MKKSIFVFLPLNFSFFAFASDQSGQGEGGWLHPIWGIPSVVWQIVNLILVIALFYYLLKRRLPSFLRARHKEIIKQLEKANEDKKKSAEQLNALKNKMATLDDELKKIREDALKSAEREKENLLKKANETQEKLKREAEEDFKRMERDAEKRIREVAVKESISKATEIVKLSITEIDEQNAFEDFIKELKEKSNG